MKESNQLGLWEVVAIGVGGMVGGGIFAVLGLSVQLTKGAAPLAFAMGGVVALLTAYSYAKLSVAFPSRGGTVTFLNRAFGSGIFFGALNVLLWITYIVMLSLYAQALGSYAASLVGAADSPLLKHGFLSLAVVILTALNVAGSGAVGRAELWIVVAKVTILTLFVAIGVLSVDIQRLEPATWSSMPNIIAGSMLVFLAYEGFELIANTAESVESPRKILPRAYAIAVVFVIVLYICVAGVTVGNLSIHEIVQARDYALAEAARPFLGAAGFTLISLAAVLSTGSALNATLYGTARISFIIAKEGELPEFFEHKVWRRPVEGLLITSGLTLLVANLLDLSSIAMLGSAGFLMVFAMVNAANATCAPETNSRSWVSWIGVAACITALAILLWKVGLQDPYRLLVLAGMIGISFIIEVAYRTLSPARRH